MTTISTSFFSSTPYPEKVAAIIQKSLERADPYSAVDNYFSNSVSLLTLRENQLPFESFDRIILLSIGKAALPMGQAAMDRFTKKIHSGLVIYKNIGPNKELLSRKNIQFMQGDHPIPGKNSVKSGMAILDLVKGLGPSDLLLVLISGGGSALAVAPANGISLRGIQKLTQGLLASGATIQEMNIVRKHLDKLKGGGLVKLSCPAKILSVIISDVMGNDISSIASGLTAFDDSTFEQANQVLEKYHLVKTVDPEILKLIHCGIKKQYEETLKSDDPRCMKAQNQIILSNSDCILAGLDYAREIGWSTFPKDIPYTGESRIVGVDLARILIKLSRQNSLGSKPRLAIFGGEPTVTLKGKGKGGRNLELALAAVEILDGVKNVALISFSTDGEDGPTDAAGAIITGETASLARCKGLNPQAFLENNDSYHFFEKVGGLIKTGPTGTNVNDLVFLSAF